MEQNNPVAEAYPIALTVVYPERSSRLLALSSILFFFPKMLLLVPHLIVLWVLSLAVSVVWLISQFAVLFTGRYPKGFFDFVVGFTRWQVRLNGYFMGLTDKYPPFSLE